MNSIQTNLETIFTSLTKINDTLISNSPSSEVVSLFIDQLPMLSKHDETTICDCYDEEAFITLIPYICTSLKFYIKKEVKLGIKDIRNLIISFLSSFDQVVQSSEDMFTLEI